eukprot:gnl/MRDRNA2_/MRDRNA2_124217_c0_seq1.p1 gnl/MRDRNA2_/MRDRNA2_124217_c0~~gnl/MRDRNA2_/MRDRNA2_124217_c0_seq1.p1  ORF type:complete len:336 (+),score=45.64 gnl/MRDRNA2_/MRDRNA2_124217_c0_seq1:104-1111(+)
MLRCSVIVWLFRKLCLVGAEELCPDRPSRFIISGAGIKEVNGEYVIARLPSHRWPVHEGQPAYSKQGSSMFIFQWHHNGWAIAPASAGSEACFLYFVDAHGTADMTVPPLEGWISGPRGKNPAPRLTDLDVGLRAREINGTAVRSEIPCCSESNILLSEADCVLDKENCDTDEFAFRISLKYSASALGVCLVLLAILCGLKERTRRRLAQCQQREGMEALEKVSPSISLSTNKEHQTNKTAPATMLGKVCWGTGQSAEDDCAICLDQLHTRPVRSLRCQHMVHTDCIDEYLAHKGGRPDKWCCPICKQNLLPDSPKCSSMEASTPQTLELTVQPV